jgi:raffinose/stachyose/melibiose transport system permease protein
MSPSRFLLQISRRLLPLTVALLIVAPLVLAVLGSLQSSYERGTNPLAIPEEPMVGNYAAALEGGLLRYWANSALVTTVVVAGTLLLASMAAYAFARLRFRGSSGLRTVILSGMMVPVHAVLIPLYVLTTKLHLHGTLYALVGPYLAFGLPLTVVLLTAYFAAIPRELEDAARLDGCSEWALWWRVAMPIGRPGLVTAAIVQAVWVWNEYPIALVLCNKAPWRTLPVGLASFQGQYQGNVGTILAGVVLASAPLLLLFFLCQRHVVRGLTAGAVKG